MQYKRKTEHVYLQGKATWVKHITPNQWNKWDFTFYPNAEALERLRELQAEGLKNVIKKDEDGYYVHLGRPTTIRKRNGSVVPLEPPFVVDKDGVPLKDTAIGNGSDVTVKLEVYPFGSKDSGFSGIAARWEGLRIDNLVPYNPEKDLTEDELETYKGLTSQPVPTF